MTSSRFSYKCSYTFKVIAGVETHMSLSRCIHHKQINTMTNVSLVCNFDILPDTRGLRFGQPRLVNVSRNFGSELFTSNASAFWICVLVCVLAIFWRTSRNLAAFWNCVLKKSFHVSERAFCVSRFADTKVWTYAPFSCLWKASVACICLYQSHCLWKSHVADFL